MANASRSVPAFASQFLAVMEFVPQAMFSSTLFMGRRPALPFNLTYEWHGLAQQWCEASRRVSGWDDGLVSACLSDGVSAVSGSVGALHEVVSAVLAAADIAGRRECLFFCDRSFLGLTW